GSRPHDQISLWFQTSRIEEVYEVFKNRQLQAARAALADASAASPEIQFLEDLYEPFYGGKQFSGRHANGFELVFQSALAAPFGQVGSGGPAGAGRGQSG